MFRNKSARTDHFAMIPASNIQRSSFRAQQRHLTTFDSGYIVPIYVDEVLPGDTFNLRHTIFARMSTPIYPILDNLYLDTFYFFVPLRLIWSNFKKFMGEQINPADSISYVIPQQVSPAGGYAVGSLQDYLGLPTAGMLGANTKSHSALFTRAYNLIWNEWFRDENLQNSITVDLGDGPDSTPSVNYVLKRRGKRRDYFTSSLPWPQKGATAVSIPLAGTAPIKGLNIPFDSTTSGNNFIQVRDASNNLRRMEAGGTYLFGGNSTSGTGELVADLTAASGVVLNQLRQSIMIQELLELDARGGTRYIEMVKAHFGVVSPDARLQRPEYLGGGSVPVNINPIAQTTQTGLTGGSTPLGTLAGVATAVDHGNGFTQSFTEHGIILGFANVRADLTYQQGLHRMFTRSTRYDHYFPAFAHLGEKAVRNDEIYCDGSANDILTFGYQEAWAEYRFKPNRVSALFKSTSAGTIDGWHLAQKFTSLPALNDTFIQDTPPLSRILAVGASANGQQIIADCLFDVQMARSMPVYSVPGLSSKL